MRKKIRIIVVAGVIAAVGGIAIAARDAKDEGKAAAPPAGAPMAPQVPVAEVITRTVAPSAEYTRLPGRAQDRRAALAGRRRRRCGERSRR